jgi:hypothetical protein
MARRVLMSRLVVVAVAVIAWGGLGCGKHINPAWCAEPDHSDPACGEPAPIDAPSPSDCPDDADCTKSCTGPSCPQQVCLPDGGCVDDTAVLFAAPAGTGTTCTRDASCALATAIDEAAPGRQVIVLAAGTYPGGLAITHAVQILGDGATLQAASTGPTITVTSGAAVELDDVAITGSVDDSGVSCLTGSLRMTGVKITQNAVGLTSACDLTVQRSTILGNPGGAMVLSSGSIDIRNNFIVRNGAPTLGKTANVILTSGVTGTFDFNTVAYNDSKQNGNPGIQCDSAQLFAIGNLITDNTHRGQFNVPDQIAGICDFSKSKVAPGLGNNDLHWVNVATDFHLTKDSTAVLDAPASELMCDGLDDFDGTARPVRGCDYGADELSP